MLNWLNHISSCFKVSPDQESCVGSRISLRPERSIENMEWKLFTNITWYIWCQTHFLILWLPRLVVMPPFSVDLALFGDERIQAALLHAPAIKSGSVLCTRCSPPDNLTQATRHRWAFLLLQHEVIQHELGVQSLAVRELHQPLWVPGAKELSIFYSQTNWTWKLFPSADPQRPNLLEYYFLPSPSS